jgi:hypothetical protein
MIKLTSRKSFMNSTINPNYDEDNLFWIKRVEKDWIELSKSHLTKEKCATFVNKPILLTGFMKIQVSIRPTQGDFAGITFKVTNKLFLSSRKPISQQVYNIYY